ncbi:unnamed protein product [Camellia sinensis]
MAFKAFFSRFTSSFKFCRAKNSSNIPENPIQLPPSPLFIDCQPATPLPFKPRTSFKHRVSSIFGCGFRTHEDDLPESPPCKWDETPRRDYNSPISSDSDGELFHPPPPPTRHPTTSISGDSHNQFFPPPPPPPPPTPTPRPVTTSSADSGLCGYESDDEKEKIVTLSLTRNKRMKKLLPSFPAEGKLKDSFAVVMESVDPHGDVKASMIEMVLAKQLFEERDLEQLLECFLSLNSRHHYGVIVDAFSDIWKETGETAAGTALIPTRFVWPYRGGSVFLCSSFTGPFENGNYGTVNIVFLARESDYVPGILNPQMHSGSNMDVDNEAFQRLVRVSGGPLHEALPRVSEADLEVSRHRITIFLSTHMAYELLLESGKGIPMAPLWDFCNGQFVGVLSALDFIMIVREAGPDENLKDVALKILQNNVATVPVIHSSSGDASIPQLLHLASLSGILKCICRYFKHSSGDITDAPTTNLCNSFRYLGSGNWGNKSTAIGNVETTFFSWFSVEFVSSSDITALAKDKIYTHINLEEMTINQALQLGQEPYSPYGSNSQRCHMCLRSDPLHKVMERLANPGMEMVWHDSADSSPIKFEEGVNRFN